MHPMRTGTHPCDQLLRVGAASRALLPPQQHVHKVYVGHYLLHGTAWDRMGPHGTASHTPALNTTPTQLAFISSG